MPQALLTLVKRSAEFLPQETMTKIPRNIRGIYLLHKKEPKGRYKAVYVGMSGGTRPGIRERIHTHARDWKSKWTHFSIFEVHDNISENQIRELEGLLIHIYRKDKDIHERNKQKRFSKLNRGKRGVRKDDIAEWK